MSRITKATKREVVSQLVIDEYSDCTLTLNMGTDGSGNFDLSIPDPKREERESLRKFIEDGLAGGDGLDPYDIIKELARRDEASVNTWGADKGQPRPFTKTIYFDRDVATVMSTTLAGREVNYETAEIVKRAVSTADSSGW